jgi:4'-phosphopantetheinyl transferase
MESCQRMSLIDVYSCSLDLDSAQLDALFELLNPEERAHASRFRSWRDRNRFAACRGLLRQILASHTGEHPGLIRFVKNRYGKPALEHRGIKFNVSHAGGRALIAVTQGREVGVDIERIDPSLAGNEIAETHFSPAEAAALRALPREQQTDAFFRCWVRKEAYIKARGFGLSMALDSFEVTLGPDEPAALLRGGEGWSLQDVHVAPGFAAAIAAEGSGWSVNLVPFSPHLRNIAGAA